MSALQEICAKKHWDPPHYELVTSAGPSHNMNFLYKVYIYAANLRKTTLPMNFSRTNVLAIAQLFEVCLLC